MKQKINIPYVPWRFYFLIVLILVFVFVLIFRLADLAIFKQHFLQSQSDARILRVITLPAFRGMITDRDGSPLAISSPVYSIWMDPQEFLDKKKDIQTLAQLLNMRASAIQSIFQRYEDSEREFVYLKRDIPPAIADQIKLLQILGVYLQQDYKRFYPEGEVMAHVIGFTNIDDQGQEGLELAYDSWLKGLPGKKLVMKDRLGRIISEVQELQKQRPGRSLTLSINRRLQYIAYRELIAGVQLNQAESASLILVDAHTGEILAMVNQPSYNPNNRSQYPNNYFRNRAVTDTYEPGSTIKSFTIAEALESNIFQPTSIVETSPGWLRVGHNLVKDEHNNGRMTLAEILKISSNVGLAKVVLSLPQDHLWQMFKKVGFGEITGIGFPGERSGELVNRERGSFDYVNLGRGYGLSVTVLQIAQAYTILANEGIKVPLSLLMKTSPPQGERVMSAKIAKQMLDLLESVTEKGGTGRPAHIDGYHIAGKTGTSHIVGKNGYEKDQYYSSFVGIAPADRPRFVMVVLVRNPQGKHYFGGSVAAPIFQHTMEQALHIYNVPPDDVN